MSKENGRRASAKAVDASAAQLDFAAADPAPIAPLPGDELPLEERIARCRAAAERAEACRACSLGAMRTRAVYGDGSLTARIVFVGEAPGADEDRQGVPFVGRAGQLLNKMIEAMGFKREEVYICNTLKCRPPENRDPEPKEKAACRPFLIEQIEVIRPSILVALGSHAAVYLTGKQQSLAKLRQGSHLYHGVEVMATYHPAYLLRDPGMKPKAWEDMQRLVARYNELFPRDRRQAWKKI
jgi:DNA polymerase